jgi:energy-coupling factor transport system substrate-specific component
MTRSTALRSSASRPTVRDPKVIELPLTSVAGLLLVSLAGLAMFLWPLVLSPPEGQAHAADAPLVLFALLPGLLAVALAQASDGTLDAKAVAMLGVLSAVGAALRPLGAGVAGIEMVFFLLILAGRAYGAGFGFLLGSTTLFASALLTGGVGPWLPFQMLASSWVGAGAGLLPRATGRREVALLAAYGIVAAYLYGFLMNMWFWPFAIGSGTELSFVAGDPVAENLRRFVMFNLLTSTWGWDTGRAITNAVAIVAVGAPVATILERAGEPAFHLIVLGARQRSDLG